MARSDYAAMILGWVNSAEFSILEPGSGWPSIVEWKREGSAITLALHVSQAGDYYRAEHEWRFQNPAGNQPVDDTAGYPILLGFDETDDGPILVPVDGRSRVGRTTRFSILFNKNILAEARQLGIAKYVSTAQETMYAIRPKLFATALELLLANEDVSSKELREIAFASGFTDEDSAEAADRTRRATNVLVRDHRFGRSVREAYGDECAMCGLGCGLTAGAHIYPVSAPDSPDHLVNGVSLCCNHHAAYDNYDVWFDPGSYEIRFSPRFLAAAETSEAIAAFIGQTRKVMNLPSNGDVHPSEEWIGKRREFYAENYHWL